MSKEVKQTAEESKEPKVTVQESKEVVGDSKEPKVTVQESKEVVGDSKEPKVIVQESKEVVGDSKEPKVINQESKEVEEVVGVSRETEVINQETKKIEKTDVKTVNPEEFLANFNWHKYEEGIDVVDQTKLKEFEIALRDTAGFINQRDVIEGTVIRKTDRDAIIDINSKSEGVISLNEFRYNPNLSVGDKVEVLVDKIEDRSGQLVLSHRKARVIKAWERVNNACETGEIVNGFIKCRTRGGMIVDIFGIEAFLPGSQIDVKPIRDYDQYLEKTMEFKVVKINHEFKNVVVSHKALIEADLEGQKREIISQLEKGQVLEGSVKNITSYGVFVDLGGVDGLIHITDLSWSRISHPTEVVDLDQKLNVVILDFDDAKSRIQLGLKQLSKHPWEGLDPNLKEGDKIKGKVVVLTDYGAFVEIIEGVEGLVHVSEMSWSTHLRSAQDFVKVGDEIETQILTLDREDRKISLGIKQLCPDPWTDITSKYQVGSQHTGMVRNYTNFGVFVELEEGIDGLIYISDLSWIEKVKHPSDFVTVGESLEVKVLELDIENRKLNLGHKQTQENPWDAYELVYTINSIHKATIKEKNDKGATVVFEDGVEGFAPNRYLEKEEGGKLDKGDNTDFKILEFNKEYRKIVVSHTDTFKDQEKKNMKIVVKKSADSEKTTLGDIGGLAELKKQMEKEKGVK